MSRDLAWLGEARALRRTLDGLARDAARLEPILAVPMSIAGVTSNPIVPLVDVPDGTDALTAVLARWQDGAPEPVALRPHGRSPGPPMRPTPEVPIRRRAAAASPPPVARAAGVAAVAAVLARRAPEAAAIETLTPVRWSRPEVAHTPVDAPRGLERFAARVPGGAIATAQLVVVAATRAGAVDALARAVAPTGAGAPASQPAGADHARGAPALPAARAPFASLAPTRPARPTAPAALPASAAGSALAARPVAGDDGSAAAPASIPPPRGLSGLLAWWDQAVAPDDAAAPAPSQPSAAEAGFCAEVSGEVAPPSVARVLERVLLTELRRHGVPWEET